MKKFGLYVVFGEGATDKFEETGKIKMQPIDGQVIFHEFDTEAERRAYIAGVNESRGWFSSSIVLGEKAKVKNKTLILA